MENLYRIYLDTESESKLMGMFPNLGDKATLDFCEQIAKDNKGELWAATPTAYVDAWGMAPLNIFHDDHFEPFTGSRSQLATEVSF